MTTKVRHWSEAGGASNFDCEVQYSSLDYMYVLWYIAMLAYDLLAYMYYIYDLL
jgi:hypothetical protein